MANKTKKVSINALEQCLDDYHKIIPETIKWHDLEVTVKPLLSLSEMVAFVQSAADGCFTGEDEIYAPETRDAIIDAALIETYTNLTLPSNGEKMYEFLMRGHELIEAVLDVVDKRQWAQILGAINERISYRIQTKQSEITQYVNRTSEAIDRISEAVGGIYGSVSPEELQSVIDAMTGGKIDEEKLVKAYFDQKNNQE